MDIYLYKMKSDILVLDKVLSDELKIEGVTLKNSTDILSPSIPITGHNLKDYNYMYIPEFGRYYFVEVNTYHNIWEVNGTVDVRMTYKNQIRNLSGTVIRNAFKGNSYLKDGNVNIQSYRLIGTRLFPHSFDASSIILMTAGNGGN